MKKFDQILNIVLLLLYTLLPIAILYVYVFKLDNISSGFETYMVFTNTIISIAICFLVADRYYKKLK